MYYRQLKSGGDPLKLQVKLSGDGAKMSHTSNLFVFTFAVLDIDGHNILSSAGMIHVVVTFFLKFKVLMSLFFLIFPYFFQLTIQLHLSLEKKSTKL
jgi:hypothetical protein